MMTPTVRMLIYFHSYLVAHSRRLQLATGIPTIGQPTSSTTELPTGIKDGDSSGSSAVLKTSIRGRLASDTRLADQDE